MVPKSFVPKSFVPKKKAEPNRNKVLEALKGAKDKVIDATSSVIAAPAVLKYKLAEDKANRAVARAKEKRALKERDEAGVQDSGHYSDPLFRYRINAINEAFDKEKASAKD